MDVWDLEIPKDTKLSKEYRDTLGGIVAIKGGGYINEPEPGKNSTYLLKKLIASKKK